MAKKPHNRKPLFFPGEKMLLLAGVLFCLVLISTALLGGLFARYTTSGSGSDSARVVKFGALTMTETGDFVGDTQKTAIVTPGVDLNKKVVISFDASEVATIVFVEVTAPFWTVENIADGDARRFHRQNKMLEWTIADGWTYLPGSEYVYYKELSPNTPLTADIIKDGVIQVSSSIKEGNIQTLLKDLHLIFRASVIQNDGSLTPETAWDRLS